MCLSAFHNAETFKPYGWERGYLWGTLFKRYKFIIPNKYFVVLWETKMFLSTLLKRGEVLIFININPNLVKYHCKGFFNLKITSACEKVQ